jgi:hypothetical protein
MRWKPLEELRNERQGRQQKKMIRVTSKKRANQAVKREKEKGPFFTKKRGEQCKQQRQTDRDRRTETDRQTDRQAGRVHF